MSRYEQHEDRHGKASCSGYKPLEVKVDGGELGLQDGPETPEEAGRLVGKKRRTSKEQIDRFVFYF